ncbi:type II toxin-antitoxin system VapC family toxin [Gemmatimonas sp.]|uniref:type II toxin-antitoxin system VapC family toxin n=1 Tax=Gemmatimonas sp. TaxID=1962908 RepID=UPI0039837C90
MILVDTSVWIEHLRRGDATLAALLESASVLTHPFVVGELACESLRPRSEVLRLLSDLPMATTATHDEVMQFIAAQSLGSRGIGYVDVHLLASAAIDKCRLWTRDKALGAQCARLGVAFAPVHHA